MVSEFFARSRRDILRTLVASAELPKSSVRRAVATTTRRLLRFIAFSPAGRLCGGEEHDDPSPRREMRRSGETNGGLGGWLSFGDHPLGSAPGAVWNSLALNCCVVRQSAE